MGRLRLEAILSELARTRAMFDQVNRNFLESRRRFQQDLGETLSGSELQFEALRGTGVESTRLSLRTRLEELNRHRAAQMQQFLSARQRREILENLRHRKLDLYRLEQSRRDQQELDDLFLMRSGIPSDEEE